VRGYFFDTRLLALELSKDATSGAGSAPAKPSVAGQSPLARAQAGQGAGRANAAFGWSGLSLVENVLPAYPNPAILFLAKGGQNLNFVQQLLTFSSSDSSFASYYNSLLSFDDLGLNFTPSIKEFSSRLSAYYNFAT
jgi:hypothetical protein